MHKADGGVASWIGFALPVLVLGYFATGLDISTNSQEQLDAIARRLNESASRKIDLIPR